ncbi:MAG TPA: hypothetical protein VFU43_19965 [Streptosporangiaceae bacterium]|nr:hypothetical protein [Streptosporangiaceae bacterium]
MSGGNFSEAIQGAADRSVPRDSIQAVKQAITNELRAADGGLEVEHTDFFNHSFVPDLILRWPGQDDVRELFIRTDTTPAYLAEDISLVPDRRPIFFGLSAVSEAASGSSAVSEASRSAGALVTDADGVEGFIERKRVNPLMSLASTAVLQGGRGVFDRENAAGAATALEEGFASAKAGQGEETASTAALIPRLLDGNRASRLLHVMQALWVSSGASAADFPAALQPGRLDDTSLLHLLGLDPIDDVEFWRNLSADLTLEQLAGLRVERPTRNFQLLIRANLDRLYARAARVISAETGTGATRDTEPRWVIEHGEVGLRIDGFCAYVFDSADKLGSRSDSEGIPVDVFFRRLQGLREARIPISRAELSGGGRRVTYESESIEDITEDLEFRRFVNAMESAAQVRRVVAKLEDGKQVKCNLTNSTATGFGSSKFLLTELISAALLALADLGAAERGRMSNAFDGWMNELYRIRSMQLQEYGLFPVAAAKRPPRGIEGH